MTIPAIVLPLHSSLVGYTVVAHARMEQLNIVPGKETWHDAHAEFFYRARQYLLASRDAFLLVKGEEAMVWTQPRADAPPSKVVDITPAGAQLVLTGAAKIRNAELLARRAAAPLKPNKPQAACDLGLFSDDARQIDLTDYANPEVIPASQCRKR